MNCERCGKTFTEANFRKHLQRKTPCKRVPPSSSYVKPFLKWAGGKTQIIDSVLARFPSEIANYYEPFLGGGSVLLAVLSRVREGDIKLRGRVYASDINVNLIRVYTCIQKDVDAVITALHGLKRQMDACGQGAVNRDARDLQEAMTSAEAYYYWIRRCYNESKSKDLSDTDLAAMFIYLNKTCFRGLYREGPNGFNVPFGHYKNPAILDDDHMREISTLIKDVEFSVSHYDNALMACTQGDFVYLDPPYVPEKELSFVGYTVDGFNLAEHKRLFAMLDSTVACRFLLSNADVPLVWESFPQPKFETTVISCRRAINSKNPDAVTNEVLIAGSCPRATHQESLVAIPEV
jgi:DNA adenine methylase